MTRRGHPSKFTQTAKGLIANPEYHDKREARKARKDKLLDHVDDTVDDRDPGHEAGTNIVEQ